MGKFTKKFGFWSANDWARYSSPNEMIFTYPWEWISTTATFKSQIRYTNSFIRPTRVNRRLLTKKLISLSRVSVVIYLHVNKFTDAYSWNPVKRKFGEEKNHRGFSLVNRISLCGHPCLVKSGRILLFSLSALWLADSLSFSLSPYLFVAGIWSSSTISNYRITSCDLMIIQISWSRIIG